MVIMVIITVIIMVIIIAIMTIIMVIIMVIVMVIIIAIMTIIVVIMVIMVITILIVTLFTTRNDGCGLEVGKAEERFTNHERQEVTMKQQGNMRWRWRLGWGCWQGGCIGLDEIQKSFNSCSVKTFHFFLDAD